LFFDIESDSFYSARRLGLRPKPATLAGVISRPALSSFSVPVPAVFAAAGGEGPELAGVMGEPSGQAESQ
jgi:hypothetical protein